MTKVLDLFSGIGGFSLGMGAAGFETLAFVEIDPFCQKVLRKHWRDTPIYGDIRDLTFPKGFAPVITGGFPCQDISLAAEEGNSLLGKRSGLWFEYSRIINEVNPDWVVIENVEALRSKGLGVILRGLAHLGYDAEWHIIPAYAVGLPHIRRRLWIVAYSTRFGFQRDGKGKVLRFPRFSFFQDSREAQKVLAGWDLSITEPLRSYDGIPHYVDRVRALGNSIVPHIAYKLGLAILGAIMKVKLGFADDKDASEVDMTYEEWSQLYFSATYRDKPVRWVAIKSAKGWETINFEAKG